MLTRSYRNPAGEVEEKTGSVAPAKRDSDGVGVLCLRSERVLGLRGRDWRSGPRKRVVPAGLAMNKEGTPMAIRRSKARKCGNGRGKSDPGSVLVSPRISTCGC